MTPFLYPRRSPVLSSLATGLLVSAAVCAAACGGTGGTSLFGNGGSTTGSGGGNAGTGALAGNNGSTGVGASPASTGTGDMGGASASSGTASTTATTGSNVSSGTTSASASSSSSGTTAGCAAGYTCVDDDPAGFTGHYYVSETNLPAPAAPPCPANLTAHTANASPAGPAQCTACSCGTLTGAACSPPDLTCWAGSPQCNGNVGTDLTSLLQDGMCHKDPPGSAVGLDSCKLTAAAMVTAAGSCAPSATDFPNKGSFQQRIDACGADTSSGSCGAGKVCIPQGPGAPNESLCVRQDGDVTCPAGWTTVIQGFTDAIDTRACTACSCGDGNTTCGDSHYTFYQTGNCTSGAITGTVVVGSSTCTNVTAEAGTSTGSIEATLPQPKGTCPAGGGAATGMVTPENPFTFCCQ